MGILRVQRKRVFNCKFTAVGVAACFMYAAAERDLPVGFLLGPFSLSIYALIHSELKHIR